MQEYYVIKYSNKQGKKLLFTTSDRLLSFTGTMGKAGDPLTSIE
jgi:hypothetical protein